MLSDCLKTLGNNKQLESQLKTYLFELQSCRLREHELEHELRQVRRELDAQIESLHARRDIKLSELNTTREQVMRNPHLVELKARITDLNKSEIHLVDELDNVKNVLASEWERLVDLEQKLATKRAYAHLDGQHQDAGLNDASSRDKSWEDVIAAENETIRRSRQILGKFFSNQS